MRGNYDEAVADFTQALRFDPKYIYALINRGVAHQNKAQFDQAIADATAALQLDPVNTGIFLNRGLAEMYKGEFAAAMADFDKTLVLDPQYAAGYYCKAVLFMHGRNYQQAEAAIRRAVTLAPKDVESALLASIVARHTGTTEPLLEAVKTLDLSAWPAPAVAMLLGTGSPESLTAAAEGDNPRGSQARVCQAEFYLGEFALRNNKPDEARRFLSRAMAICPKDSDVRVIIAGEEQ